MNLVVVTPVGPGHEAVARRALISVEYAKHNPHPFHLVQHRVVDDTKGKMGRSAARNSALGGADWYFFLDADDEMEPDALSLNDFDSPATFGAVKLNGRVSPHNVHPCTWDDLLISGAKGTLSMGFFCRAGVAEALMFDESLDRGEDFDFYMRLPGFTKIRLPLVNIGSEVPSATGPRGYESLDWLGTCRAVIEEYL